MMSTDGKPSMPAPAQVSGRADATTEGSPAIADPARSSAARALDVTPAGENLQPSAARESATADDEPLSADQLRALPAVFAFDPIVPRAFGISRSAAYRALAKGELPITPMRIGRKLKVRRADLLEALSISD